MTVETVLQSLSTHIPFLIGVILIVAVLSKTLFIVRQKTAAVVERLGRFHSIRTAGLNFKIPIVDKIVAVQNLKIQQLDVEIETKTKDNVFVNTKVSVQYYPIPARVRESFYSLDDPAIQIESYVFDTVRSEIPKMLLDDVFSNKDSVALSIKESLMEVMTNFGYQIENSLITDLQPEASVKEAMNRINATHREKEAADNEAEAQKIRMVKIAEAEAESKRLQGQGLANQRQEIARGIRESIETLKESGVDEKEVMTLLLVTQHYDAIQDIAKNSRTNTIMLNYSPTGIADIATQIREATLSVVQDPAA
ncbi:MAG: SPFH domain-containing protein [Kofleriaceae bacterium]|nr:SPFH domain-containing protein [Kofleriaceae bacterium]